VANGSVVVVDAGLDVADPQFVGDPINLAARLQHPASNEILFDRRTYARLTRDEPDFLSGLKATSMVLDAGAVKGQLAPVRAWLVEAPAVHEVASEYSRSQGRPAT